MARNSSSVNLAKFGQGIGGNNVRPSFKPWNLPSRMARKNCSSVQLPIPVALSGVRLAEKETPQGPTQAVKCSLVIAQPFFTVFASYGFNFRSAGCPESRRSISGSGMPFLYFLGEWQSSQTEVVTKCSPLASN